MSVIYYGIINKLYELKYRNLIISQAIFVCIGCGQGFGGSGDALCSVSENDRSSKVVVRQSITNGRAPAVFKTRSHI